MGEGYSGLNGTCESGEQFVSNAVPAESRKEDFHQRNDRAFVDVRLSAWQKLYLPFKRALDILLSLLGLVFTSPLFLIIAVAIKAEDRGSVIYRQVRVGKDGRLFRMYKFRSMCSDADELRGALQAYNEVDGPAFKMEQDPRITRAGRFIRRFSMDELPQLLNVLKGEMSIVGPRPPLESEMVQYTSHQMQRLKVKPGLTCYWQVSGRSNLSFERWMELDILYIQRMGLLTDLVLILRTIPAVIFGAGAY